MPYSLFLSKELAGCRQRGFTAASPLVQVGDPGLQAKLVAGDDLVCEEMLSREERGQDGEI